MNYIVPLVAGFLLSVQVLAVPVEFDDPQQQHRYQSLLEEIRCLVCQNQSLADSNADLARDLRNEIYKMVQEGKTNQEITGFLVTRYGDFVLYRPPLKTSTLLLWFGPFLLLLAALIMIYRFVKSTRVEEVTVSDEEKSRLSQLLQETNKKQVDI